MSEQTQPFDPELARRLHRALVERLGHEGLLGDRAIAEAFGAVARHHFLPGHPLEQIYADQAVAVKRAGDEWLSSSSQPAMMAIMLNQLGLMPGHRVLEVGAGTGYNAALIASIVGREGRVVSLDIDADLVAAARANLAAAGCQGVEVRQADGALGAPDAAPFDRIIVTAGAWDLLPAWREQLAPGGRIVVPVTVLPGVMLSLALERRGTVWEAVSARPCGFVLLRGAEAHPGRTWGHPAITLTPRDERAGGVRAVAVVEKEWSELRITWGGPGG
ncbi:MAG TPA: methyltransferase domain-containing protein [Chloroflexaceae bacterium]|nr:methyltransferase domain-containing protein [Chloroflexaceae bacterium]